MLILPQEMLYLIINLLCLILCKIKLFNLEFAGRIVKPTFPDNRLYYQHFRIYFVTIQL